MYIAVVPNRSSPPAILLRESFRERGKVKNRTLANLSGRPASYLLLCTPAAFERYFARIAADQRGIEPPAWARGPIPDVTTVGPQIVSPATRGWSERR